MFGVQHLCNQLKLTRVVAYQQNMSILSDLDEKVIY